MIRLIVYHVPRTCSHASSFTGVPLFTSDEKDGFDIKFYASVNAADNNDDEGSQGSLPETVALKR